MREFQQVLGLQALIISFIISCELQVLRGELGKELPFTQNGLGIDKETSTIVIETKSGKIRGESFILRDGSQGLRFLGIPFALPPVGEMRFKAPEIKPPWKGVLDARSFGPICYQPLESDVWDVETSDMDLKSYNAKIHQHLKGGKTFMSKEDEKFSQELRDKIREVEEYVQKIKNRRRAKNSSTKTFTSNHKGATEVTDDLNIVPEYFPIFSNGTQLLNDGDSTFNVNIERNRLNIGDVPSIEKGGLDKPEEEIKPVNIINGSQADSAPKNSQLWDQSTIIDSDLLHKKKPEKYLYLKRKYLKEYLMSEDCLSLNIYTPLKTQKPALTDLFPVVVFIHGGSFYSNGGRLYPGERLSAEGVIVITVNYRLGPFGFLSTGDSSASGNWGLLDQRLSLWWINEHIESFRGDRKRILLVGNSAGAASVIFHMLSPLSKGLFSRVAAMSGCALAPWSLQDNPLRSAQKLARGLNCPISPTTDLIKCIRGVSADKVNQEFTTNVVQDGLWLAFTPVVEGDVYGAFLPTSPQKLMKEGKFMKIPLLMMLTRDEVTIWFRNFPKTMLKTKIESWMDEIIREIFSDLNEITLKAVSHVIRSFYIYEEGYEPSGFQSHLSSTLSPLLERVPVKTIANLFSDIGLRVPCMEETKIISNWTPIYLAEFAYASGDDVRVGNQQWIGSYHESDLQYFFGQPLVGIRNSLRNVKDAKVSTITMGIMKSFAEYGAPHLPAPSNLIWPPYNVRDETHLEISDHPKLKRGYHKKRQFFWIHFLPLLTKWPIQSEPPPSAAESLFPDIIFSTLLILTSLHWTNTFNFIIS